MEIVAEDGHTIGRTRADADGAFSLVVEEIGTVFVLLRKDGYATTTFPGVVGASETQTIEAHALYLVSEEQVAAEEARFAGCEGAGGATSVGGEIRLFGYEDPVTGVSPLVETGKARIEPRSASDDAVTACYLQDDGAAFDPEAYWTGDSGTFGFFGLPPGRYALEVRIELSEDLVETAVYPVFLPDEPLVRAPWYPAWVEFPF